MTTLPFNPREIATVFVSFSGGKDSTASLLRATRVFNREQVIAVFLDTGNEAPETYQYLRTFSEVVFPVKRLGQRVVGKMKNGNDRLELVEMAWSEPVGAHGVLTLHDLVRKNKRNRPKSPAWPSPHNRFCTKQLKQQTFEKFVRKTVPGMALRARCTSVLGIRRAESRNRANTLEWSWNSSLGINVWCPLVRWLERDVFDYTKRQGVPLNSVYERSRRANCVECFFASDAEVIGHEEAHPGILDTGVALEKETGDTWKTNRSLETLQQIAQGVIPKQQVLFDTNDLRKPFPCMLGFCVFGSGTITL